MIRKIWRFVLLLAAFVLVSAAFQRSASAFAQPCPPGYTGPAVVQFGCCLSLPPTPSTLSYYSYFCNNGFPTSSMRICSNTPCNSPEGE